MDNYDKEIEEFTQHLTESGKNYDTEKIKRAYGFAKRLHEGQKRNSGEPYISHPVAVAEIAAGLGLDTDSICAALLHDTIEDCAGVDLPTLKKEFGSDVAELVDGLTKFVHVRFEDKEEEQIENLRKMFLAMSKDIRVIFIKLCDRLHNVRTLSAKTEAKQRVIALETMQVYAPLAHRLGVQKIKQELENTCLAYLDPIGYGEVKNDIDRKYGANKDFIEKARQTVADKLTEQGISFTLEGRVKSVYSVYRKMYEQNKSFDEIYDFYALRVIVETEQECYQVLGIIHDMFNSMPGRFKDYISIPKANMYRSLHTTVIGRDGIPFEVQIRTAEMHRIAEYGIAAHWKYKSGAGTDENFDNKLEWVAKLVETEDETKDHEEFMSALKMDIFHDETFVFTPKGDVISLPYGATIIDFAYAIHSGVGNKMTGAKINGMIVPIDTVPKNGEIVEIITSQSSKGPSRDWLNIVKTSAARSKIRQFFKKENREDNIAIGREAVEKELRHYGRAFTDEQFAAITDKIAARVGMNTTDDLFNEIGFGGINISSLAVRLKDEFDRTVKPEIVVPAIPVVNAAQNKPVKTSRGGIIIDGVDGLSVKLARCCNPLPGDKLIGFITKGYGVSVHKQDCPNVRALAENKENSSRFVSAEWSEETDRNELFEAKLDIFSSDRTGLLADVASAFSDMHVSITNINSKYTDSSCVVLTVGFNCKGTEHLSSITSRMRQVKGVTDVKRKTN